MIFEAILLPCDFWHIFWKRFKGLSGISIQDFHFHILAYVNRFLPEIESHSNIPCFRFL